MGHSGANFSIAWSTWLWISEFEDVGRRDQGKLCPQCKFSLRQWEPPLISRWGLGKLWFAYPTKFYTNCSSHSRRRVGWYIEKLTFLLVSTEVMKFQKWKQLELMSYTHFPPHSQRINVFTQKNGLFSAIFFFFQRADLELPNSDISALPTFLNGNKPHSDMDVLCMRTLDDKGCAVNSPWHSHLVSVQWSQLK